MNSANPRSPDISIAPSKSIRLFLPAMFAEVAFPISSYQTFSYSIPKEFANRIQVGLRVKAPLGKRVAQGIIVALPDEIGFKGKIRPISDLVDDQPIIDEHLWALINWISRYYLTPVGQVARAALPRTLKTGYSPPTYWTVNCRDKQSDLDDSLNNRPAQRRALEQIQTFDHPTRISELNDIVSNPLDVCRKLAALGLVDLNEQINYPDATGFSFAPVDKEIVFSEHQQSTIDRIAQPIRANQFYSALLHGVTGSGKTEIYIELVRQTLELGKTTILLLPEISLTPQIAGRFRSVFGEKVALWHSKLSTSARAWTWRQICAGNYQVVIGARSAIFSPLRNLGLVVVDEEQEHTYKQESPEPRYHARDVALMRGKLSSAVVVLASATPSLESYYNQIQSKLEYLTLPERFGGAKYPEVHLVDMNREQEESGKAGLVLSGVLLDKISERLSQKEQVILLQNRRGYAPIMRCRDCGEILTCPHCQINLTYHSSGNYLQCHFCGYQARFVPDQCPDCSGSNLYLVGTGTQKVEELLRRTFAAARISRLDLDTTRTGAVLTRVLEEFGQGKQDILLGTQMIAKGLDFENATLVGIINADTGMFLPDFRSGERVFQLIYQAAGRAGRHRKPGEVVIQTYNPESPVIKQAARLDIKQYYNIALSERHELNYTPFSWMARIEFSGLRREKVEAAADDCRRHLSGNYRGLEILGPAPCYRERIRNQFRFQILLKSKKEHDSNGSRIHRFLQEKFSQPVKHSGVRRIIDVDPMSIL